MRISGVLSSLLLHILALEKGDFIIVFDSEDFLLFFVGEIRTDSPRLVARRLLMKSRR
jgi:hypothetical protein